MPILPAGGSILTASDEQIIKFWVHSECLLCRSGSNAGSPGNTPSGGIIMYSGLISAIPNDWALCDGKNNTPNLVNNFVVGTDTQADIGTSVSTGPTSNVWTSGPPTAGSSLTYVKLAYIMKK